MRRSSLNFFAISSSSVSTTFQSLLFEAEDFADVFRLGLLVFELLEDAVDFQRRDAIQCQLEDRVGLLGIERKGLHQPGGRVGLALAGADDLQGLFEPFEDDHEAFQDVNPPLELPQLEFEPPRDAPVTEVQKVPKQVPQAQPHRHERAVLVRDEASGVDGEILLQRRVPEQVGHDGLGIGAWLDLQNDPQAVFFVALVGHADELRQLAAVDDVADRRQQRPRLDAVRAASVTTRRLADSDLRSFSSFHSPRTLMEPRPSS